MLEVLMLKNFNVEKSQTGLNWAKMSDILHEDLKM
jgi:hypothetical protein